MKKIILSILFILSLILPTVSANIISPYPWYPSSGLLIIPIIFLISWAFDFLFLGLIYSMLDLPIKNLRKFSKYTFVCAIGGLITDCLMFFIPVKIVSFMVLFVFLFVWNYFLSRIWIGLSERDAIIIGIWMGLITNPVLWFNFLPFYSIL
jgi:hypothetical protein